MLSLGLGGSGDGRQKIALGFRGGGEMEENELEEGEACDDTVIDPDIALSYIDEKLNDVLGHFQKDFEVGLSVENLGAKFGHYGSFLPMYQHSPTILSQPRSPPKVANSNASRSLCCLPFEASHQNPLVVSASSISRSNISTTVPSVDRTHKKDSEESIHGERESIPQNDSLNSLVSGSDQKTLKVRIKVGSDNISAKNNAPIYSGLGLDVTSSSTLGDSPDGSSGISPGFCDVPGESPRTILQIMACFPVTGGFLLSPLNVDVLQLTEKMVPLVKKCKTSIPSESVSATCELSTILTPPTRGVSDHMLKKVKPNKEKRRSTSSKNSKDIDDIGTILSRDIDIETSAGQELVSDALNIPLLSCSRIKGQLDQESMKESPMKLDPSKESRNVDVKCRVSAPDLVKDNVQVIECVESDGAAHLENGVAHPKGKLKLKTSKEEKALQENSLISQKGSLLDLQNEIKGEVDNTDGVISEGYKKVSAVASVDNLGKISSQKATLCDQGKYKGSRKEQLSEDKRLRMDPQVNVASSVEFPKDNMDVQFIMTNEDGEKGPHGRTDQFEKKSKGKSRRELDSSLNKDFCGDIIRDRLSNGSSLVDLPNDKLLAMNLENDKDSVAFVETLKDKSGNRMIDKLPISEAYVPMLSACNTSVAEPSAPPPDPVMIEEDWVCCDDCQKWRLLPYGTNPDTLPKKWQCSMLDWLPGMNSCEISEEETKKAVEAHYMASVPEIDIRSDAHKKISASSITMVNSLHRNEWHGHNRKRKNGPKDGTNLAKFSYQDLSSTKKNPHHSMKSRSVTDGKQQPSDTKLLNEAGPGFGSKSADVCMEKQKPRNNDLGFYSGGGDSLGKNKHSNTKSKRMCDQGGYEVANKIKKEESHHVVKDLYPEYDDLVTNSVQQMATALPVQAKAITSQKHNNISSCKEKYDSSGNSLPLSKRIKVVDLVSSKRKTKENFSVSDVERCDKLDFSARRASSKEQQEIQYNPATARGAFCKNEALKGKKQKLPKSEGRVSKGNARLDKGHSAEPVLSSNRGNSAVRVEDIAFNVQEQHPLGQSKIPSLGQAQDLGASLKSVMAYAHNAAANSSSSKLSCSRKSKSNGQEGRGSPVESVSSSPLRICSNDKLYNKRGSEKDEITNAASVTLVGPKRCSDTEIDWVSGKSWKKAAFPVQRRFQEVKRGDKSCTQGSLQTLSPPECEERNVVSNNRDQLDPGNKNFGEPSDKIYVQIPAKRNGHPHVDSSSDYKSGKSFSHKERQRSHGLAFDLGKAKLSGPCTGNEDLQVSTKASVNIPEKGCNPVTSRIGDYGALEKDEQCLQGKVVLTGSCSLGRRYSDLLSGTQKSRNSNGPSVHAIHHKHSHSGSVAVEFKSCDSNIDRNFKLVGPYSESATRTDKLQTTAEKQEKNNVGPQMVCLPVKESRLDVLSTNAVNCDARDTLTQVRKPEIANGVQPNSLRQAIPNPQDCSSPLRKDGQSAAYIELKEARDLKHKANRMKSEGRELEGISLCFEAALKFLHVASLVEPVNFDCSKQGDAAQSIQMYSETAKLCESCALDYGRFKKMAATALAYKCAEVAYLKAAYYKYPGASKDRHELQIALQLVPPGESPSSSASDIDHLNNQGLCKASSAKDANSPQLAHNQLIAVRNHAHLIRLLTYTNDLNCAFEATKKSRMAIATADIGLEKGVDDGISSVKRALDFNFHNIKGLLHLVRLSMESISR